MAAVLLLTACVDAAPSPVEDTPDLFLETDEISPDVDAPLIVHPDGMPMLDPDSYADPEFVPAGGSITMSMRMPLTLNPLLNEDITVARILRLMYEPLIGLDDELRPYSKILESFELSESGTSATLVMREGLQWDNEAPITVNDIVFSFNTLSSSSAAYSVYRPSIEGITSFVATGPTTITVNFSQPTNHSFAYRLNFPIIPSHHFLGAGAAVPGSTVNMNPVGNGAFRFVSYRYAQEMVLSPNNFALRPRANIGRIRVLIIPDDETDMHAFNSGVIDVIRINYATNVSHNPILDVTVTPYTNGHFEFIGFNFNNSVMAQLPFRRAVAHSLNLDNLVASTYLDKAARARTPIIPSAWFHDDNTLDLPYSPQEATSLLDEAGLGYFSDSGLRGTQAGGVVFELDLRILVNSESPERIIVASALAESLRALQLNAEVVILEFEEYANALHAGDFEMFVGGLSMPVYGDIAFAFSSGGGLNFLGYSSPIMDAFIEMTENSTTQLDFGRNITELQHFFAYDIPVIGLVHRKAALLTTGGISGELRPSIINVYNNINEWFIP